MSDAHFNIVFYGIIQSDKNRTLVVENMAKMFKTTPDKIQPYFSGDRKVIKANVDELTAQKYRLALENIGLKIKLEPATADPAIAPQASSRAPVVDTSGLSMAALGADVLEHPATVTAAVIGDISGISLAQAGANVLEHPVVVAAVPIGDISGISLAEAGANVLEHPPEKKAAPMPDISALALHN